MFSHLQLKGYEKALASVTRLGEHSAVWNQRQQSKAAAYLDLCRCKAELDRAARDREVDLLGRLARLIRGLSASSGTESV